MKLAIMQPYIFPYIGYFQLIHSADVFVVYDDVNYIKQGWINRNNLLVQKQKSLFTVPLQDASSFRLINEIDLSLALFEKWKIKFSRTIDQSYKKAPFFAEVWPLVEEVFSAKYQTIAELNLAALKMVCNYLGITTRFVDTSTVYNNQHLRSSERVIDICRQAGANTYINAIGGRELYDVEHFAKNNLDLFFIQSGAIEYHQFGDDFIPYLSILDTMMFNSKADIQTMLDKYQLIQ